MNLRNYVQLIFTLPPHIVVIKAYGLVQREFSSIIESINDKRSCTYQGHPFEAHQTISNLIGEFPPNWLAAHATNIEYLAEQACEHKFDLLGSGLSKVQYGMTCKGLNNVQYQNSIDGDSPTPGSVKEISRANRHWANQIRLLISPEYIPIDWQLDFKSGYRWSALTPSKAIKYGNTPGADIKVPWELSRMQHLTQFALAYGLLTPNSNPNFTSERNLTEFKDQILDFITTNPPRFGVNWVCTMDVAIRVSNWLFAYNMFSSFGAVFGEEFDKHFKNSLFDHGCHIVNNLEWSDGLRSNHYLANIVGLLIIAAYLPSNTTSDSWLSFSIEQLTIEMESQFQKDGSNFEASTNYHRLSAEMLIYGIALLSKISPERIKTLPAWNKTNLGHTGPGPLPTIPSKAPNKNPSTWQATSTLLQKLNSIMNFALQLSQPNGDITQIGDNDSGRFIKLQTILTCHSKDGKKYIEENHLNHKHLIGAYAGFLKIPDTLPTQHQTDLEFSLFSILSPLGDIPSEHLKKPTVKHENTEFPDFGVYVFQNKYIYMTVRCGSVGQNNNGGHGHNDQLSFTASFKNVTFFVDSGTYLYTPDYQFRNKFRSTSMHNTVSLPNQEQNQWIDGALGLFSMSNFAEHTILTCDREKFIGEITTSSYRQKRDISFNQKSIECTDTCSINHYQVHFHLAPEVDISISSLDDKIVLTKNGVSITLYLEGYSPQIKDSVYSPAYGVIKESKMILYTGLSSATKWYINYLDD